MKSLIPVVAVSILSATFVVTTCAADVQEKRQDLIEKKQEVREAEKELKQESQKEFVESTKEANKEMLQVSRASKINGTNVKNTKGENMGGIKDLVIDPESGRVVYAVVSFGGILGLGNKLFAIPWSVLKWNREKEYYVLDLDKETLKNAPGFDKKHWPDSSNKWELQREQINQFYHVNP
ncbi:MAG: PRC-barrel domain-containing protein [Methylobacter sp.]